MAGRRESRDQLAADALELAGVSVELVVAGAAAGEHLTHQDEPTCVQKQVVDVMVENGCAVYFAKSHAASSSTARPASTGVSAVTVSCRCATRILGVRAAPTTASTASVPHPTR